MEKARWDLPAAGSTAIWHIFKQAHSEETKAVALLGPAKLSAERLQDLPTGLIDEVPVENGGVLLIQAAIVGVAPVDVVLDVVFVHLAALPVCVEVVRGLCSRGPVDVAVQ